MDDIIATLAQITLDLSNTPSEIYNHWLCWGNLWMTHDQWCWIDSTHVTTLLTTDWWCTATDCHRWQAQHAYEKHSCSIGCSCTSQSNQARDSAVGSPPRAEQPLEYSPQSKRIGPPPKHWDPGAGWGHVGEIGAILCCHWCLSQYLAQESSIAI